MLLMCAKSRIYALVPSALTHTLFLPWLQRSKEGSKAPGTQLSSNVVLESIFKCVKKDKLCHAGPRIYRFLCVPVSVSVDSVRTRNKPIALYHVDLSYAAVD